MRIQLTVYGIADAIILTDNLFSRGIPSKYRNAFQLQGFGLMIVTRQ